MRGQNRILYLTLLIVQRVHTIAELHGAGHVV